VQKSQKLLLNDSTKMGPRDTTATAVGTETVLPLERPYWGKPLCFALVPGFEALPAGSIPRYIPGNFSPRIFFGAAIGFIHAWIGEGLPPTETSKT
jgi:hypothetical protein